MARARTILHVDMDAFFAAIEQLDRPELRGKPVLVGSDRRRGVVATASYEARVFGCHSAQPMAVAKRHCPHAIVAPVRGQRYREVSRQIFALFDTYTPLIEPLSIDEAFLDLTGTERLFGSPIAVAGELKQKIHRETGLTASVGVASNKFLAKLASEMQKPDGLTVIPEKDVEQILAPLPIRNIWGIGPATAARLEAMSIRTVGDLRDVARSRLLKQFGREGERFYRLARGLDHRRVTADHVAKSIGQERTFETDVSDVEYLRFVLLDQVEQIGRRLRSHQLSARTMTIKLRYGDFQTITRNRTVPHPTHSSDDLWSAARSLFDHWVQTSFVPIRLIGASGAQISTAPPQLYLFNSEQQLRGQRIDRAKDQIQQRFGKQALRRGINRT